MRVWGLPISEDPEVIVLTNGCDFAFEASATDMNALRFHWATNGVPADCTASNFVGQVSEGTNTVHVYAEDAAGNVCDPINRTWVVDITPPSNVVFTTELSADKVINLADVTPKGFKVMVKFSEDVVEFTAASVAITNGNGMVTAVETNSAASYTVWVMPAGDGLVPLQIAAGAVKDLAGNGNVAPDVLERMCDITPPTVTLESSTPDPFNSEADPLTVTVTFSESVTNFTAASIAVENGTPAEPVKQESLDGISEVYEVEITPTADGKVTVSIAAGVVADAAGNPNAASEDPLTRIHDTTPPTKPVISGTPADGATVKTFAFSFTAASTDATSGIDHYVWILNDDEDDPFVTDENTLTENTLSWYDEVKAKGKLVKGLNTVKVYAVDGTFWNLSDDSEEWVWMIEPEPSENVEFGDEVFLRVDPDTGATNAVSFTMVDFHPGEVSTFALREFELKGAQATSKAIKNLTMRFIVGTNVLDYVQKRTRYVKVNKDADFDNGTLTVTIPREGTRDENGKPFESFFIFGVDNKEK